MGSGSSTQVQRIKNDLNNRSINEEKKQKITQTGASEGHDSRIKTDQSRRSATEKEQATVSHAVYPGQSETPIQSQSSEVQHLDARVKQLEKEIGENESEKLDLLDQIERLEERMAELVSLLPHSTTSLLTSSAVSTVTGGAPEASGLQETLRAKDQYIDQLERELITVKKEARKVRVHLKKRIKALTSELNVTKQETSITQMELKEQLQNYHATTRDEGATEVTSSTVNTEATEVRHKVILDLSLQVCEQAERISQLEKDLQERDEEILTLRNEVCVGSSQRGNIGYRHDVPRVGGSSSGVAMSSENPGSLSITPVEHAAKLDHASLGVTYSVRPPDKPGTNSHQSVHPAHFSEKHPATVSPIFRNSSVNITSIQSQSTILSDSDSDWEIDKTVPSAKVHSAPPRVPGLKTTASADKDNIELVNAQEAWTSLHCAVDRSFLGTDKTPVML